MFQTKVAEKIKTHFIFSTPENHVIYEIMWKNIVDPGRPQMTILAHAGYLRLQIHTQDIYY
jgi:hypothetical protein